MSASPKDTRSRSPRVWRREGIRPVCAIYSTFLQRAYDNVIHDVAIQRLPVVFAMDRAGLVGEDGPTHMGLYDIAYMLAVPGMTVTAPKDAEEMLGLLRAGVEHTGGPFCFRYPRDSVPDAPPPMAEIRPVPYGTWEVLRRGSECGGPRRRDDGAAGTRGRGHSRGRRPQHHGRQLSLPQAA